MRPEPPAARKIGKKKLHGGRDCRVGKLGQRPRCPHHRPDAADIGKRN